MGTFRVGSKVVQYTVRENSDSKYLILNLRRDRLLEISLPRKSGLSVKKILEKKRPWIERMYEEVSKRTCVFGRTKILYRGQTYPLKIVQSGKQNVEVHEDKITINVESGQSAREALKEWMSRKSREYSMRKAAKLAKLLGIDPVYTIETKDMKSWGRCVNKKHLVFNWQLIALPPRLAGYVVAHELVHLVEGSHSKKFERKLAAICPQYKELREELKNYSI